MIKTTSGIEIPDSKLATGAADILVTRVRTFAIMSSSHRGMMAKRHPKLQAEILLTVLKSIAHVFMLV